MGTLKSGVYKTQKQFHRCAVAKGDSACYIQVYILCLDFQNVFNKGLVQNACMESKLSLWKGGIVPLWFATWKTKKQEGGTKWAVVEGYQWRPTEAFTKTFAISHFQSQWRKEKGVHKIYCQDYDIWGSKKERQWQWAAEGSLCFKWLNIQK